MQRDIRVDIHIHSRASDGVWTAAEVAAEVEREGIELFAVSDHNTMGNVAAARIEAQKRGLYFLPAVEIDTTFEGNIYHILGYGIDEENGKPTVATGTTPPAEAGRPTPIPYCPFSPDERIPWSEFQ